MNRKLWMVVFALFAAGLIAAGCGGDDDGDGGTVTTTVADDGDSPKASSVNGNVFDAAQVYEIASPGVVTISSIFGGGGGEDNPLGGGGPQAGQGSGFVISDDGEIATNAHVVTDGEANGEGDISQAREVYVQFPDRNQVEAEVVGFDPFADVALLKIDPEGLDLQPVELGDIEEVQVGEPVAAIGSPFGERQSLSVGIVSQTDRSIPSLTQFTIDGAIQTDASINPGNSGGPLLDAEGRVVGINQQIDTTTGGNQGVGFAVPIDLVKRSLDELRSDGEVDYAFLGVTTQQLYPQLAEELDVDAESGAIVEDVQPDSPAEEAGLKSGDQDIEFQGIPYSVGGDIIVAVDGQDIVDPSDLPEIVSRLEPGETVDMEIIRDGERETVEIKLAARPS